MPKQVRVTRALKVFQSIALRILSAYFLQSVKLADNVVLIQKCITGVSPKLFANSE